MIEAFIPFTDPCGEPAAARAQTGRNDGDVQWPSENRALAAVYRSLLTRKCHPQTSSEFLPASLACQTRWGARHPRWCVSPLLSSGRPCWSYYWPSQKAMDGQTTGYSKAMVYKLISPSGSGAGWFTVTSEYLCDPSRWQPRIRDVVSPWSQQAEANEDGIAVGRAQCRAVEGGP